MGSTREVSTTLRGIDPVQTAALADPILRSLAPKRIAAFNVKKVTCSVLSLVRGAQLPFLAAVK